MIQRLTAILSANASEEATQWLTETLDLQTKEFHQRKFYYAFSGATRHFPKTPLSVGSEDTVSLQEESPDFTLSTWTQDQLARSILLLVLADQPADLYRETLTALIETADMREAAAIFATFPLLPDSEFLVPLAREGLRTNIVSIFDSIALQNPFPAAHFDDEGWNQMVLKCFFLQRPTHLVLGIDRRANAELAEALSNYAHERWAAQRPVSPDLWRSTIPFVDERIAEDLTRASEDPAPGNRQAVALVASASDSDVLSALRSKLADLITDIESGSLSWETLGASLYTEA